MGTSTETLALLATFSLAVSVLAGFFRCWVVPTVESVFLVDRSLVEAEDPLTPLRDLSAVFLIGEDAFVRDLLDVREVELLLDGRVALLSESRPFLVGPDVATAVLRVGRAVVWAATEVRLGLTDDAVAATSFF